MPRPFLQVLLARLVGGGGVRRMQEASVGLEVALEHGRVLHGAADHVAGESHQSTHGATKDRGKGRQQGDRQGKGGQQQAGQARVEVVPIP